MDTASVAKASGTSRVLSALLLSISVGACGGGGGGGESSHSSALGERAAPMLNFPTGALQQTDIAIERAYANLSFGTPLVVAAAPGDDTHLYVANQNGVVQVFEARAAVTPAAVAVFLDLSDRLAPAASRVCWAWPSIPATRVTVLSTFTTAPMPILTRELAIL